MGKFTDKINWFCLADEEEEKEIEDEDDEKENTNPKTDSDRPSLKVKSSALIAFKTYLDI